MIPNVIDKAGNWVAQKVISSETSRFIRENAIPEFAEKYGYTSGILVTSDKPIADIVLEIPLKGGGFRTL